MNMNIQLGHIARHTPPNAGAQGREAAVIDVAQDLLLRNLHTQGILNCLAIKGGTAIRKLYAGREGRFSLDLDFAVIGDVDQSAIVESFIAAIDGSRIGSFSYRTTERRGKWSIAFGNLFISTSTLTTKLDFSPSPWLAPVERGWCPLPIHHQYGETSLPRIKTIRLEENIAEKIARLNRTTTARDLYDLRWIACNPSIERSLDKALVRRLSVLKIWVDTNGMHAGNIFWRPGHTGSMFDPKHWLRERNEREFDVQDIGALALPTPSPKELCDAVQKAYGFLANLDTDETTVACSDPRDRALVIQMIAALPGICFDPRGLY